MPIIAKITSKILLIFFITAGDERIELPTSVFETEVIPLN